MTTHVQTFEKSIRYDRESKDYMLLLDGELRGYARSYHEAEVTLDKLVYDLLQSDLHRSASELDGGSDADEIAADMAGEATRITRHTAFRCECGTLATRRAGGILFCNQCWVEASALCPSCGDALTGDEPRCAACRESEPAHTCYGLAANCGKPAAHRVDMPGMVMWLCGWCYADWGGADPAPLTLPRAIALAVGDPAPPVDDGPDDNWGGFRAPRQVGG